jgi:hypothetical protein
MENNSFSFITIGFRILAAKLRIFFHYFAFLCFFFLALRRISYFESHFLTERQSVAQSVRKPRFVFFFNKNKGLTYAKEIACRLFT